MEGLLQYIIYIVLSIVFTIDDSTVDFSVILTGVTGSGKSSACNFYCNKEKEFPTGGGILPVTMKSHAAITTMLNYKVRIIDSPGFCDDHVTEEEHMKELGRGIMFARQGVHAIGLVLAVDGRFTGAEATMLKEMEHFGELWPYMFILFTKAKAQGDDDGAQRFNMTQTLSDPRCPDSLKLLMRRVDNRFIMLESVAPMGGNYHQDKCIELIRMIKDIFEKRKKVYTNTLFQYALELYEKEKEDEKNREQALIQATNQAIGAYERAKAEQEQNQRIFEQAFGKLQESLDRARKDNERLQAKLDKINRRSWWEKFVDAVTPDGCKQQ